ncbi:MAG: AraC family transcriptional regulator [Eubacteriales bacterium]|nr:AraC family transcriptional regulator [Eubacteriales bacterium]
MADRHIFIPKYELLNRNISVEFRTNGAYIPAHWHSALEITYLLDGHAELTTEGISHTMVKGEFSVVDAGKIHEFYCPHEYMQLVIYIDNEYIASFTENRRDYLILCDRTEVTEDLVEPYLRICTSLGELVQLCINHPFGYRVQGESLILGILFELLSRFSIPLSRDDLPEPSKDQKRIKEIVSYIEANYDRPITLEEISRRFGLSSEYFSRFFKNKIGISFKKHLNQVRLSHIYHDLCSSDAPIMEIVEQHGFTNYKLFNRMFREAYGTTPRDLRRLIAKIEE